MADQTEKTIFKCDFPGCGREFDTKMGLHGHMIHHKRADDSPAPTEKFTLVDQPSSRTLTPEEQAIVSRISGETNDWQTIGEESMVDFSLSEQPFKLPKEAQKHFDEKRFVFRWAERTPKRIDTLRTAEPPMRWIIVNKTTCPWIGDRNVDPVLGCVCRHDQLLMFKPWSWNELVKREKLRMAGAVDMKDIKNRNGQKGDGYEWKAGESYKISGGDQIIGADYVDSEISRLNSQMGITESGSPLGDTLEQY